MLEYKYPPTHPSPPTNHSEYDYYINKSTQKLWTNDLEIKEKLANKFTVASTNIRSLSSNHSELDQIAKSFKPDVLVLNEIWNPHIGAAHLDGYHNLIMKTRPSPLRGGGVGIYISSALKYSVNNQLNLILPGFDDIWIEVEIKSTYCNRKSKNKKEKN